MKKTVAQIADMAIANEKKRNSSELSKQAARPRVGLLSKSRKNPVSEAWSKQKSRIKKAAENMPEPRESEPQEIESKKKKKEDATAGFRENVRERGPAIGAAWGVTQAGKAGNRLAYNAVMKNIEGGSSADTQRLMKSVTDDMYANNPRGTKRPTWQQQNPNPFMSAGPHYWSDFTGENQPYIYAPKKVRAEIMAHELGHSLQSNSSLIARNIGQVASMGNVGRANNLVSMLGYLAERGDKDLSDQMVYGSGLTGALSTGAMLGNEIGASVRGHRLMRRAGLKPKLRHMYGGNTTYALMGLGTQGIPMTLAAKRFIDRRREAARANEEVPEVVKEGSDEVMSTDASDIPAERWNPAVIGALSTVPNAQLAGPIAAAIGAPKGTKWRAAGYSTGGLIGGGALGLTAGVMTGGLLNTLARGHFPLRAADALASLGLIGGGGLGSAYGYHRATKPEGSDMDISEGKYNVFK